MREKNVKMAEKSTNLMKSSRTMPQLCYTREDIQEQYLATTKVRKQQLNFAPSTSSAIEQQQQQLDNNNNPSASNNNNSNSNRNKRVRAQSTDPRFRRQAEDYYNSNSSDYDDANDDDDVDVENNNNINNVRKSRKKKRKKLRKRAQSASIFSACFTIPKLGSMITNQVSNFNQQHQHQRRAFMQHLTNLTGTSSHATSSKQQQRPISASKTLANIQQHTTISGSGVNAQELASKLDSPMQSSSTSSSTRKHVSFNQKQHQDSIRARADIRTKFTPGTSNNNNDSNDVIIRNNNNSNQCSKGNEGSNINVQYAANENNATAIGKFIFLININDNLNFN